MPRIRTIKPQFWSSPRVKGTSPWARLLFIAMWNYADDWGRAEWTPRGLLGFAFPHDAELPCTDAAFPSLCKEVADNFDVVFYTVHGRHYYQVMGFEEHQRTERRAKTNCPAYNDLECELDYGIYGTSDTSEGTSDTSEGTSDTSEGTSGIGNRKKEVGNRYPPTVVGGCRGVESSPAPSAGVEPATGAGTPAPPTTRGHRLPDRWAPARSPGNQQIEQQFTQDELRDQFQRFSDYWRSQPGQKGVKTNWDATWRNWLRKSLDMRKPRQTPENARIEAMYRDAATRQVSVFQQIVDRDRSTRQEQPA